MSSLQVIFVLLFTMENAKNFILTDAEDLDNKENMKGC